MRFNRLYAGCSDYLDACRGLDSTSLLGQEICAASTAICRATVEGPAETISDRSPYDIRALGTADIEPSIWIDYLNTPFVQDAIGVDLNYTSAVSTKITEGFLLSGDWSYNALPDLEALLEHGVRVALIHGDAVSLPCFITVALARL